jgi:GR25 family glycosyltransferase involved in LPS biosynthesis
VAKSALESGTKRIYLALDGPRNQVEHELQKRMLCELQELASEFDVELRLLQRSENLGLALAIISALDWFFENEAQGIIFEDDLVIHQDFYPFAAQALRAFQSDPLTWIISGNQFFTSEYFGAGNQWSHYPLIWGWACWSHKWTLIRDEIIKSELEFDRDPGIKVRSFLQVGKYRTSNGTVNSWAIPFSAAMKSLEKYCFMPPQNLVSNIGKDKFASHTINGMWHLERDVEYFGHVSNFDLANREQIASNIDKLIEDKIYQVSWKSTVSVLLLRLRNFFPHSEIKDLNPLVNRVQEARKFEQGEFG